MSKFDIYEMVTNLIIERLEAGVIPWKMPWKAQSGLPMNLVSKRPYTGINFWYLLSFQFERPYFLTFNQIQELGGSIKQGSKSYVVVFWKMLEREQKDGTVDQVPYLRYYRIFNLDDVTGIDPSKIPSKESQDHDHEFNPIQKCDNIINNWIYKPKYVFGVSQACYSPATDEVRMPKPETFFQDEQFYSTFFHEIIHSCGHNSRLKRHQLFPDHRFGSQDYSQEELVAEMGASFLCGICNIENQTIDNSAAYIQSWLKKLKNDKHFVMQAATHAQKSCEYILDNQKLIPSVKPELEDAFSFS